MSSSKVAARAAIALGILTLSGSAQAGEEKIPVEKLPPAVQEAVKAKFLKAKVVKAVKAGAGEKIFYGLSLKGEGRSIDVSLKPNGTILEVRKTVSLKALPPAVRKALTARYPKARFAKIRSVSRGGGPPVYRVVVQDAVALSSKGEFEESEELVAESEESDEMDADGMDADDEEASSSDEEGDDDEGDDDDDEEGDDDDDEDSDDDDDDGDEDDGDDDGDEDDGDDDGK